MKLIPARLDGVYLLEPVQHRDERGFFMESFRADTLKRLGLPSLFIQDNHSLSVPRGTLRGMHYQTPPKAQTKLIRVLAGAIHDVVVDMRENSRTFGQWEAFLLSEENSLQLLVPKGFAHGFCTLQENAQVLYKVDALYSLEHDRGIAFDDPDLAIPWPVEDPVLSDKDGKHPRLAEVELYTKEQWEGTA